MRVIVDTNVLLNAVLPTSGNHWLFQGIINGAYTLCVTNEILSEYAEIFSRFYGPAVSESFLTALIYSPFVEKVDVYFRWLAIKADADDDDKFVDCAVAANAHCVITNDRHFDVLAERDFSHVAVLAPHAFRALTAT